MQKKEKNNFKLFIAGVLFFILTTNLLGKVLFYIEISPALIYPMFLGILIIIAIVLIKKKKYLGLGFLLSIPAVALFIATFAFELWIHPPDEE